MKKQPKKHQIVKISLRMKDFFKSWLAPMILLILGSYLVYLVMSLFSTGFTFKATFFTDSSNIYNSISNFIELNVAILGIVLTVVAIVVQLAAQKYTPKLADLFLENKINRLFFFFMVFNLLFTIFITYSIKRQLNSYFYLLGWWNLKQYRKLVFKYSQFHFAYFQKMLTILLQKFFTGLRKYFNRFFFYSLHDIFWR